MIDEMTAGANTEEGWRMFEQQFDNVHRDFMRTLAERYPSLTPMELKVCALTKMDLSTKEIAKMLFVSVRNVQNHRYRLRKKLKLDPEANLVSFLTGI
jgi:DNA-binding CsgD family transcriptional regulator